MKSLDKLKLFAEAWTISNANNTIQNGLTYQDVKEIVEYIAVNEKGTKSLCFKYCEENKTRRELYDELVKAEEELFKVKKERS